MATTDYSGVHHLTLRKMVKERGLMDLDKANHAPKDEIIAALEKADAPAAGDPGLANVLRDIRHVPQPTIGLLLEHIANSIDR
jgi:hypothetical protein